MTENLNSKYLIGAFFVFIGAVMFAGKAVIVKWLYIHYPIDTVSLLALRMLFSLPFYIIILLWNKWKFSSDIRLTTKEWAVMLAIGLLGYYLASFFDFWDSLDFIFTNRVIPDSRIYSHNLLRIVPGVDRQSCIFLT